LEHGNLNPGKKNKLIQQLKKDRIWESRGHNGGRVICRRVNATTIEILAVTDKHKQDQTIDRLENMGYH